MISFADLLQKLSENSEDEEVHDAAQEKEDSALMGVSTDVKSPNDKSDQIIRAGLNINPNFWNDFIKITNDSEALADLLGVDSQKVSQWGSAIERSLKKVQSQDAGPDAERKQMISTGNAGKGI
jgi:hypothetical protein